MKIEKTRRFTVSRHVIPGICADARKLGISREYLWRVLRGKKNSPKLVLRYEELQLEKGVKR